MDADGKLLYGTYREIIIYLKTKHPKYECKRNIWMKNKDYWKQRHETSTTTEHQQMPYLPKQCSLVSKDSIFYPDNFSYF